MKSELSSRQHASLLLLILIFHLMLLIAMFMIKHHHETLERLRREEPIILFEETSSAIDEKKDKEIETIPHTLDDDVPWKDWVAIDSSLQAALQEPEETISETYDVQEEQQEAITEDFTASQQQRAETKNKPISSQAITDALNVAQHVLASYDTTIASDSDAAISHASEDQSLYNEQPTKLTFAQLAKGFKKHVKQTAALDIDSDKKGKARIEQLKHIHYMNKVMDCIETSCKIATIKISPHQPITKSVCIQFALNRNGSLHTLTLVQSSGNKDMDTTILDIFKDASSAFPPVPALFQEPYRFPTVTFLSPNDPQNRHVKRTLTIRHY